MTVCSMVRSLRRRWSDHRPERTIVLLGSLVVVALSVSSAVSIVRSYRQMIARTEAELQTIAKVLAAQTQRELEAVELAQASIEDSLILASRLSRDGFADVVRSKSSHDLLLQKKQALPAVDAFMAVSLDGRLLNLSRTWPAPTIDASDREFVRAFQNDATRLTFLSEPLKARGSGLWSVFMAHKMAAADGAATGIILAAIRLDHFEDFYSSLALPADASVNLFRRDGIMLARYPHAEPAIGGSGARQRALFGIVLAKSDSGLVRQVSSIDGKERIIAGQTLDRFPAVITVTRTLEAILAPWKTDAIQLALVTILADGIAIMAGLLGLRQVRHANRLARFDAVTNIPNRTVFHEAMATAFQRRSEDRFALLVLDLDQFKEVNDSFGHQAGDALLQAAAARIQGALRPTDILTRLGGDEFAVVSTTIADPREAEMLAMRIIAAFAEPFAIGGQKLLVGVSVGVAVAADSGGDPDMLYRDADLALYRAKTERRGTHRLFAPDMAAQRSARKALTHDLQTAIGTTDLHLAFQPLLDLKTQSVRSLEALARWTHPVHGAVAPGRFIPLAEDSGLIGPLGRWVLRQACLVASRWPNDVRVAVNVSAVQFRVSDVLAEVVEALALSGLAPDRLELEITETVQIVENGDIGSTLRRIKALGVRISLDDFGTGYSSLSYLRSFPFDKIKIDMSFVATMLQSPGSKAIVETVLALAQKLGIDTTAEGVETHEQLARLRELGCTEVQGFYVGAAVAADDAARVILHDRPTLASVA